MKVKWKRNSMANLNLRLQPRQSVQARAWPADRAGYRRSGARGAVRVPVEEEGPVGRVEEELVGRVEEGLVGREEQRWRKHLRSELVSVSICASLVAGWRPVQGRMVGTAGAAWCQVPAPTTLLPSTHRRPRSRARKLSTRTTAVAWRGRSPFNIQYGYSQKIGIYQYLKLNFN